MGSELQKHIALQKKSDSDDKLHLRNVMILDNQSTMDLICNKQFTSKINKYREKLRVQSNGGTLVVNQLSDMPGYKIKTWFRNKDITNIVSLKNIIKQYRVTYDSNEKQFVEHRQDSGLPKMVFRMHSSGLHVYDPKERGEANMVFINTLRENIRGNWSQAETAANSSGWGSGARYNIKIKRSFRGQGTS